MEESSYFIIHLLNKNTENGNFRILKSELATRGGAKGNAAVAGSSQRNHNVSAPSFA